MDLTPQEAFVSLQAGWAALSALAVSYSFSVIGAIVLIVLGYLFAGFVERGVSGGLKRIRGFDATLRHFFAKIARYAVLVLVLVMVLGQFGVQTASMIAAIGAIGLAIGLALQGTLQNIAAGIMLLALRPFRIGEDVEIGDIIGKVEEIGLFATRLRTFEGIYILAPNSTLWNQPVRNFTRNGVRRNDVTIGVGYDDDIELVQSTLLQLASSNARVHKAPEPQAFVSALADSAVNVTVRYWTSPSDYLAVKLDLTKQAKLAFDERGISIPFPQQEVIYRGGPAQSH